MSYDPRKGTGYEATVKLPGEGEHDRGISYIYDHGNIRGDLADGFEYMMSPMKSGFPGIGQG